MRSSSVQLPLPFSLAAESPKKRKGNGIDGRANRLDQMDRAFHDWYRFVLSFPPHLVSGYLDKFELDKNQLVLDPFCGTGTTVVEGKLRGVRTIGVEANLFAYFASSVKIDWEIDPDVFRKEAQHIGNEAVRLLKGQGIEDLFSFKGSLKDIPLRSLDPEATKLLLTNSISPLPLHKTLVLYECIKKHEEKPYLRHALLALANALGACRSTMCTKIVIPFSHIIAVIIGHTMPERALKQGKFPTLLRIKIEIMGTPTGS